jgi:hypothetical protein
MLALYETEIVDMPQVSYWLLRMLKGQIRYEKMVEEKFLVGDGRSERLSGNYGLINQRVRNC